MADEQVNDPLNFMRNMWGNMGFSLPGMVAPTFDIDAVSYTHLTLPTNREV